MADLDIWCIVFTDTQEKLQIKKSFLKRLQILDYLLIVLGLLFLFAGGEALVRGSVTLSKRLGVSALLIGVVVVGFGTSAPELLVSIKASLQNQPDIALGNVVGSNIANVLLILGIAGCLRPIDCNDAMIRRDAIMVSLMTLVLLGLAYVGIIHRIAGGIMVLALIAYLIHAYRAEKQASKSASEPNNQASSIPLSEVSEFETNMKLIPSLLFTFGGITMLVFGADFLVDGASNIAKAFGVSEATIGLSIVAVGTSLPEIATAIAASLKKQSQVIIGNVLGSNLFNILSILGITALIVPIPVTMQLAQFDIPLAFAVSLLSLGLITHQKIIGRYIGILFLALYTVYMTYLFQTT